MPNQEVQFEIAGRIHRLRFTANAEYRIEGILGRPIFRIAEHGLGARELQAMFWGALEGARLKHRDRAEPWTLDEAGDLIDALREHGRNPLALTMEAWTLAHPLPAAAANAANTEGAAAEAGLPLLKTVSPASGDGMP
ncbi:hypothetical protein IMX07_10955 [bacterium]|nr:hypothetical protein [bacterium]